MNIIAKTLTAAAFTLVAGAASAATVTTTFSVTGLSGSGLSQLGLSAGDTISGSVTYDTDWDQTYDYSNNGYAYEYGYSTGDDSVVNAGSASGSSSDTYAYAFDGISDGTSNIYDYVYFYGYDNLNGSAGILDSYFAVYSIDNDETTFSGLTPTVAEMNALDTDYFYLWFRTNTGTYYIYGDTVTWGVATVPLPASALLMLGALGGLGVMRRKLA
ncbi:MAG: VPLPA-CTERM sorting domain-containing protein [Pseudomonadota bacterium]